MLWFTIQSLVIIVPAFVLGLAVGWVWWRRRTVQFSESDAITELTTAHEDRARRDGEELRRREEALREKDADIDRLNTLVSGDAAALDARHRAELDAQEARIAATAADLQARSSDLRSREAEIARLATLIGRAESTAAHNREAIADRDARLAERQAEIDRLSAQVNAVRDASGLSQEPTGPTTGEIEGLAVAVEETGAYVEVPDAAAADPEPPEPPEDDDLERIEGVGPRIGTALREAGIRTFNDLADADTETLQGALEHAGLRFAPSLPTWGPQARLLADGDEEGFSRLTEALITGRDLPGTR